MEHPSLLSRLDLCLYVVSVNYDYSHVVHIGHTELNFTCTLVVSFRKTTSLANLPTSSSSFSLDLIFADVSSMTDV